MREITFTGINGDFTLQNADHVSYLYFPLTGFPKPGKAGLKSVVTPNLGGDSKTDQEHFLLEPVSVDDLHLSRSTRNFWVNTAEGAWSLTGVSAEAEAVKWTEKEDTSSLSAGFMWQTVTRTSAQLGLQAEITSFAPIENAVEIHKVTVTNMANTPREITLTAAIPIYGRSADNIRDHRHVTSMLHRIHTTENAVVVKPTMSFDERGHRQNETAYYVAGIGEVEGFYPTLMSFIGEGGSLTHPKAIYQEMPVYPAGTEKAGTEAMGGIRFRTINLAPGASTTILVLAGICEPGETPEQTISKYDSIDKADTALNGLKTFWQEKVNVRTQTGNSDFDNWMRWVSFQPYLRRLFGCSFLPHHDYGRGGRGWRDLWQDCLSLIIMDPADVRSMIIDNFGGVRVDGTNATIIGNGQGEFIADRNGIARVWMDHAFWPWMTTKFYIDQTGDLDVLQEKAAYFKDGQTRRGTAIDEKWTPEQGLKLLTEEAQVYRGSILEHLLVENLAAFYEVGEHNIMRLRGADWNDALDMAPDRGESVAFTAAYAGNYQSLANILRKMDGPVEVLQELSILLEPAETVAEKKQILGHYTEAVKHSVSGQTIRLDAQQIADNLEQKAAHITEVLQSQEWIPDGENGWFNSYYDNHGRPVDDPHHPNGPRMLLTGQVFEILSGTATDGQVEQICKSADQYLYDPTHGGYRLNTNFHEVKMDMGRMFGFAYGEKENGAVFSHMAVMYANALYFRGFAKEGWKVLKALADTAMDFSVSRILPGIPEYFQPDGRGVYHYLTGAASWYMMTMVTQAFGVMGEDGDLMIRPQLTAEQFDANGEAATTLTFAGRNLHIVIRNPKHLEVGTYTGELKVSREEIRQAPKGTVELALTLTEKG